MLYEQIEPQDVSHTVRFTSEEQLKAENVIAFALRTSVDACLTLWFGKSEKTDVEIWKQFGEDVGRASEGAYDHWAQSPDHPRMFLALIILLDQFRRNMYRESAEMYARDDFCLKAVKAAIENGAMDRLTLVERVFPCLVLTHSESLGDQKLCLTEWARVEKDLAPDDPLRVFREIFERHVDVVEEFGRFPHRNALLGRLSSGAETEFLERADFRFDLPLVKMPDGTFSFQGTVKGSRPDLVEGEEAALTYEGPDVAITRANEEIRLKGYAREGDIKLHKFIVERDMPAIGGPARENIKRNVDRSSRAVRQLWPRMTWIESYVCDEKIYCVFLADDIESLRAHALLTDMPMTSVTQVRKVIDPELPERDVPPELETPTH